MPPPPSGDARHPQGPYSATSAVGYGWRGTTSNLGATVGVTIVVLVAFVVITGIISSATTPSLSPAETQQLLDDGGFMALFEAARPPWWSSVITQMVTVVLFIPLVRVALAVVDDGDVSFRTAFETDQIGQVAIVAVILGLASGIANTLPILGIILGLAIGFLAAYAIFFVIGERRDAMDALRASAGFAVANAGPVILVFVLSVLAVIAGLVACLVGVLVAIPVAYVAQAYTFRHLRGDPIAPR